MVKGEVDVFSEKEELDGGYQRLFKFLKKLFPFKRYSNLNTCNFVVFDCLLNFIMGLGLVEMK